MSAPRWPVAVAGATGVAGGQALVALANHPWFEVVAVAASERSAGRRLGDVFAERQAAGHPVDIWPSPDAIEPACLDLPLQDVSALRPEGLAAVFSMLPSAVARELEPRYAATTPVFSCASAFRDEDDTPLLLAGVNASHAELLDRQGLRRGWKGFVAPGPNCTTVGLAVTLAPLVARHGVSAVIATSMQALSGAGAGALELAERVQGNVLPFIPGEEQKVERETRKILGGVFEFGIVPAAFKISVTCTRVPVRDGHLLSVSLGLRGGHRGHPDELVASVIETWCSANPWGTRALPSRPEHWIEVLEEEDRPQPRLDVARGGGMTTLVGRVRPDPVLGGIKYVVLTHNAVLGAAGGAVLMAEDLRDRGLLSA